MGKFIDPDEKPKRQVGQAAMPTRESVTRTQLDTLHTVIQNLSPFLLGRPSFFMGEEDTPRKIDGGVAASASVTFINVCARIDELLADRSRWDTAAHDRLYDAIAAVQKAQVDYLTAQAEGAKLAHRPSIQFKPTVANDGTKFVAYYGDITRVGYAIIGLGLTPSEALVAFDEAFLKTPQEQIIMAAEALSKPKPKKRLKNEPPLDS